MQKTVEPSSVGGDAGRGVVHAGNWRKRALNEESIELAAGVFAKDNLLDEINAGATGIIADYITEHPEAVHTGVDLVSVFRKLERAGDHITNIAEEIVFFIDAKVLKHRGKNGRKLSGEVILGEFLNRN